VADITPPVALAAYAGAAIAKSDPIKTGITATRLAITAFIVPYVFIFNPAMLFIDASGFRIVQAVLSTSIGMFGIAVGIAGYMVRKVTIPWRIAAVVGGLLLIHQSIQTDIAGFGIITLFTVVQIIQWKRGKSQAS